MESNTSVEVEGVEVGREKRVCRSGVRESEQPLIGRERPVTAGRPQSLQVKVSRKKKKKKRIRYSIGMEKRREMEGLRRLWGKWEV